jgi:hypothetical protein
MGRKISHRFNQLFNWLIKYRNTFTFSGKWLLDPIDKNKYLIDTIVFDKEGLSGKKAFHMYESEGKLLPTKHPIMLFKLIKTKSSITFQIKQWAEARGLGELGSYEFSSKDCEYNIKDQYELMPWMVEAVETQKVKFYGK